MMDGRHVEPQAGRPARKHARAGRPIGVLVDDYSSLLLQSSTTDSTPYGVLLR